MLLHVASVVDLGGTLQLYNHSNPIIRAYISRGEYIHMANMDNPILTEIICMTSTMLIEVTNLSVLC